MMVYRRARVAAPSSRGEDDVVDGDAAGEGGWRGQRGGSKGWRREGRGERRRMSESSPSRADEKSVATRGENPTRASGIVPSDPRGRAPRVRARWARDAGWNRARGSRDGDPRARVRGGGRGGARTGARDGPRADIFPTDDRADGERKMRGGKRRIASRSRRPSSIARGRRASDRSLDSAERIGWEGREDAQDELDEEAHEPHDDEPHAGAKGNLAELLAVGLGAALDQADGVLGKLPHGLHGDVGDLHGDGTRRTTERARAGVLCRETAPGPREKGKGTRRARLRQRAARVRIHSCRVAGAGALSTRRRLSNIIRKRDRRTTRQHRRPPRCRDS